MWSNKNESSCCEICLWGREEIQEKCRSCPSLWPKKREKWAEWQKRRVGLNFVTIFQLYQIDLFLLCLHFCADAVVLPLHSPEVSEIRNSVSDHIEPYYHRNRIYICSFERETERTDSNVIKPVPEQNMKKK